MLARLLRLYNKQHQSGKTPLENFTTEALVGLFEMEPQLFYSFCKNFLKLKSERFEIISQKKYPVKDDSDCIIDIVIMGQNEVCFIENKVNSSEGYRQISRYCKILDDYKENNQNFATKMVYCTKFSEPKNEEAHDFTQIKWYEIAIFLKQHLYKYPTIKLLNDFLTSKKMDQDLTITAQDLVTLQNYERVTKLMEGHLGRAKPFFEDKISKNKKDEKLQSYRYCHYIKNVIEDSSNKNWSEILYAITFEGKLHVQIWLSKMHSVLPIFDECIKEYLASQSNDDLKTSITEHGTNIYLTKPLSVFLDDEQGDTRVLEWFKSSFDEIKNFIEYTREKIHWNI